jgi:hypothetical protein
MEHTACHSGYLLHILTVQQVHSETCLCTGVLAEPEVMARMRSVGIRKETYKLGRGGERRVIEKRNRKMYILRDMLCGSQLRVSWCSPSHPIFSLGQTLLLSATCLHSVPKRECDPTAKWTLSFCPPPQILSSGAPGRILHDCCDLREHYRY